MQFRKWSNDDEEERALDRGQIVKTKFNHYSMVCDGLVYVCEDRPPFENIISCKKWMIVNGEVMTWDSYKFFYQKFGDIHRASYGEGWTEEIASVIDDVSEPPLYQSPLYQQRGKRVLNAPPISPAPQPKSLGLSWEIGIVFDPKTLEEQCNDNH